uniref:BEN domain-containing protein n=1 Tax=Anopheles epiroticus TaxID=199890 RepID=A0A182PMZ1_9DIPT
MIPKISGTPGTTSTITSKQTVIPAVPLQPPSVKPIAPPSESSIKQVPTIVPEPETKKSENDTSKIIEKKVPLHAGSSVYIATKDLLSIYTSKPAVYTGRLIQLMFGLETLKISCLDSKEKVGTNLVPLNPTVLNAVITHVVDVFQQQKQHITHVYNDLSQRKGSLIFSLTNNKDVMFSETSNGARQLHYQNHVYHRNIKSGNTEYWRCSKAIRLKCKATIVTKGDTMRVNGIDHNHIPMGRLMYGLAIFLAVGPEKQLIWLRGKLYQKTIGRAYRSVWTCIEYGCPGEILLLELKGGQIQITSAHNYDCTSDYLKNRPVNQMYLNESELTRLEQTLANEAARFIAGVRGSRKLKVGDYSFTKNKECLDKTYWSCARAGMHRCKARVVTYTHKNGELTYILRNATHNHAPF